jgi:DNA-binding CsgD family transcriptional regulator
MMLQRYLDVANSPDIDTLRARLISFANHMDFGLVSSGLIIERPGARNPPETHWVCNTPQGFLDSFHSAPDSTRDPVLTRMQRLSVPFVYDQQTYVQDAATDLWEQQAAFGYRTGVAVALHLAHGRHYLLGIDRERPLPKSDRKLSRLLADIQLLAVHGQEAASRLFVSSNTPELPRFTAREIEILRWTMEGKTSWAVGAIIGLSEHGVNHHLRSIFRKLDVATKQQAVVKALSLGVI